MIFGILVVIIAITEGKYGYHVEFFDGKDFDGKLHIIIVKKAYSKDF